MVKLSDLSDDTMLITQYLEDADGWVYLELKCDVETTKRKPIHAWIADGNYVRFELKSLYLFFAGIENWYESCSYDEEYKYNHHCRVDALPANWRNVMFKAVKDLPETQAFIDALNHASQQIGSCFKGEEVDLDEEAE